MKQQDSLIKVIGTDKKAAKKIEQALLDQVMLELGSFLEDEGLVAKKNRKTKKEAR